MTADLENIICNLKRSRVLGAQQLGGLHTIAPVNGFKSLEPLIPVDFGAFFGF